MPDINGKCTFCYKASFECTHMKCSNDTYHPKKCPLGGCAMQKTVNLPPEWFRRNTGEIVKLNLKAGPEQKLMGLGGVVPFVRNEIWHLLGVSYTILWRDI